MNPVKSYCKIFDFEDGQILVKKEFDPESEKESIRIESYFESDDCSVNPAAVMGFNNAQQRNEAFDGLTIDMVLPTFENFKKLLK